MCGIAGFLLRDGVADPAAVRAMCGVIRHRGPDDEGVYTDGACGIGMRRLSIIDLNTGHQPIPNEDETVWVVFNGEIYNFQSLRSRLTAQGHRFRTQSDTEALAHLYEQEGTAGWDQLRGMFAFAIYDRRDRSLLLVRDRFGKKPLYYTTTASGFYFGSELKCLQAAGVPLDVDDEALRLYFHFRYIPDPWSAYRGVRKLPPGSWLRCGPDGRIEQGVFWRPPQPVEHVPLDWTREAAAADILRVFDESVRLRLIADVPLGAFLSGGIDSSSVVASMALHTSEPVKTFSIGFEESTFNELPYAALVSKKYNTEHHAIVVRPDAVELMQRIVHYFDEPFGDTSAIPTFIVSEFAARHVKVVLTGDGGDELFGGYESLQRLQKLARFQYLPSTLLRLLGSVSSLLPYSAYGKNFLHMISHSTQLERYFELNYTPHFLKQALLNKRYLLPAEEGYLTRTFADCLPPQPASVLTQAMYFEATANLTGDMLVKVDRMSMANSLEVRCPLLDHELAALAARIPHDWKICNGRGKDILIRAMQERLPPELLNRPKTGFAVPLPIWYRGSLRSFLRDHLTGLRFRNRDIASPQFVQYLIDEHESGRRDNSHWLSMLLMLELWFEHSEAGSPVCSAA